jgi:hypothetical protein
MSEPTVHQVAAGIAGNHNHNTAGHEAAHILAAAIAGFGCERVSLDKHDHTGKAHVNWGWCPPDRQSDDYRQHHELQLAVSLMGLAATGQSVKSYVSANIDSADTTNDVYHGLAVAYKAMNAVYRKGNGEPVALGGAGLQRVADRLTIDLCTNGKFRMACQKLADAIMRSSGTIEGRELADAIDLALPAADRTELRQLMLETVRRGIRYALNV